jgi:hypothetical protein
MVRDLKYRFAGHQTFAFRYGWLEKGVRGVQECPTLFFEEDALVRLGVGKNMVSSIRHWCNVTQLIEFDPDAKAPNSRHLRPSEIGRRLILEGGWDPYLEDDASLWLIHWLLISNPTIGTSWQLLFSRFHRPDFTKRELFGFITSFAERHSLTVSESVVTRDIDCLVRTYEPSHNDNKPSKAEETFDCPLLQLDLLQRSPDGDLHRFAIGPKMSLPASIFCFALAQYFDRLEGAPNTLSIQKCLYGEGSPGQVFKLDENSLIEYVEDLEQQTNGAFVLDETSGLKQIYRKRILDPLVILGDYYRGKRR